MPDQPGAAPEERLSALGLNLPTLSEPRGLYVRARRHGSILYLAGHGPAPDGDGNRLVGKVGADLTLAQGYEAARRAGLGLIATLAAELGDLRRVTAILRVFGMVNVAPGFVALPAVIDGCSDLLVAVFGPEAGPHARSAIGVAALPHDLAVEIEAVVAIRD
ncbi:MAG TPA: RidA family protein [Candidatus Limnocylindrales bacterium]|nr:RidA family protein [Candidatus Limnocylindrales bacterium]